MAAKRMNHISVRHICGHLGISILIISLVLFGQSHGGPDTSICDPNNYKPGTGKVPDLPQQFKVRIECNIEERNYTVDMLEFYDYINNRGTVETWKNGRRAKLIYDYKYDELVILNYTTPSGHDIPKCTVQKLSSSKARYLFGVSSSASGGEHIFSAGGALHFGANKPHVYKGRQFVRDGTVADVWEGCWYLDQIGGTFKVRWSFTASNNWTSAINRPVPLQLNVTGVMTKPARRRISHLYEFTDFRESLSNTAVFQTDPGTYCPGRVMRRNLPNVTNQFKFEAELLEMNKHFVSWIKEYYDYDLGLVRYDYKPDPSNPSKFGTNMMVRVHDFSAGVAYNIDKMIGNCTVTTINALSFDATSKDGIHAVMRSKKQFFYFDKVKYEYAGQRLARDIDCDVFVAQRRDFPPGFTNAPMTIWEWYFASKKWMESVGYLYEFALPVRLQITCPDDPAMNIIYNIYNYDEDNPRIYKTDISGCFNYTSQHIIQFAFPGTFAKDVSNDLEGFKLAVTQQIVATSAISPLRVNNMQVDYYQHGVVISFTMLDKPPIQGNTPTRVQENDIGDAVAKLREMVSTGEFIVTLDPEVFKGVKPLVAHPYAVNGDVVVNYYYGAAPPPQGYTSAHMAGVGVGVLVAGFILGFILLFVLFKFVLNKQTNTELGFEPRIYENTKEVAKETATET